jgi:hypothetical protein
MTLLPLSSVSGILMADSTLETKGLKVVDVALQL